MNTTKKECMYDWICAGAAVAVGVFAGQVDFHNDEPQAAVLVLLVLGSMLGFARPRHAWRWGIIAALGIPATYLIGRALGHRPVYWPQPNICATLIAIIPALIGAYAGVLVRKVFGRKRIARCDGNDAV
jgi:hypothetical protein